MRRGVLPDWRIKELIKDGIILGGDPAFVSTSGLDLQVSSEIWKTLGSFLPLQGQKIEEALKSRNIVDYYSKEDRFYFEYLQQYVVKLVESLDLPSTISAKIFNKSGRGRIALSVKGLTDGTQQFDAINNGYQGNLYVEISPTAFPLFIPSNTAIPQIRFYEGNPHPLYGSQLEIILKSNPILTDNEGRPSYNEQEKEQMIRTGKLTFTADIPQEGLSAYVAKRDRRIIDLSKKGFYDPGEYYREELSNGEERSLLIHPGDFVLVKSKQHIRLPPFIAAEIDEYSPELGDMKTHYAGIINASHGYDPDGKNTPSYIVFEIRARDTPVIIRDGQKLARFDLYNMLDEPEQRYMDVRSTDFKDLKSILPNIFKKD